jgi:uncharacterized protein DUF1566
MKKKLPRRREGRKGNLDSDFKIRENYWISFAILAAWRLKGVLFKMSNSYYKLNFSLKEDVKMSTQKQAVLWAVFVVAIALCVPVLSIAGSLEPGATPAPTMKTLDQIPPTWNQMLQGSGRWGGGFPGATVFMDKETGLVWTGSTAGVGMNWDDAIKYCTNINYGGRKGWRLPAIEELTSLLDGEALPDEISSNLAGPWVWSATTTVADSDQAWIMAFADGNAHNFDKTYDQVGVMCVRGGKSEPVPAMNVPPSWSQTLNEKRFKLVLGGAAVIDKETGLVWEKSPSTATNNWADAMNTCRSKAVGNRKGWRLPTVEELASLADPTAANPSLPSGHPFSTVQSSGYWSASTSVSNNTGAWVVSFLNGSVDGLDKASSIYVWCVRGGQGVDPQ